MGWKSTTVNVAVAAAAIAAGKDTKAEVDRAKYEAAENRAKIERALQDERAAAKVRERQNSQKK